MWRATVFTLFPEMFPGPLGLSLAGEALTRGLWSLEVRDIRAHGLGRHKTVDDAPAGCFKIGRDLALHRQKRSERGREIGAGGIEQDGHGGFPGLQGST